MRVVAFLLVALAAVVPCEAVFECFADPCRVSPAIDTCVPNSCRQNYTVGCNYDCYAQLTQSLGGFHVSIASSGVTSTEYKLGGRINTTLEHAMAIVPDDEVGSTTIQSTTWETAFDVREVQRMTQGGPTFILINAKNGHQISAKVDIRVAAPLEATIGTNPILFDSIFQSYIVNGEPILRVTGRYTGAGNLVTTSSTPSGTLVGPDPKVRYMGTHPTNQTFAIDYPLSVIAQAILDGRQISVLVHANRDDFSGEFTPELKVINLELTTEDAYDIWPAATCTNEITECINNNQNDTSICGDAYHVSRCPMKCRTNEGSFVSVGDSYFYQCNTCTCSANGQSSVCTRIGCQQTCYDNHGHGYDTNATRKQDSCNTCTCQQDGTWTCQNTCLTCGERGLGCSVLDCRSGDKCVEDPSTCDATCEPDTILCPQMCKPKTCPGYDETQMVCNIKVINNVCTWVCPPPPKPTPVCSSCAATTCMVGTTCIEKKGCATCQPNVCEDKCALIRCSSGPCVQDRSCNAHCTSSPGTVVLTLSFTLRWYGPQEAKKINSAMGTIAKFAGVYAQFVIHNADIQQVAKMEYGYQKWSIKVGFKGDTYVARKFALSEFFTILQLFQNVKDVKINAATSTWELNHDETFATETETMMMQTCADGSEIKVEQQCPMVDDVIVPASTSSSSSSTPTAVIIAPIVAGVVLVAAIATAIIIIHCRRLNTIKTVDRMETQMTNNPAITSQV